MVAHRTARPERSVAGGDAKSKGAQLDPPPHPRPLPPGRGTRRLRSRRREDRPDSPSPGGRLLRRAGERGPPLRHAEEDRRRLLAVYDVPGLCDEPDPFPLGKSELRPPRLTDRAPLPCEDEHRAPLRARDAGAAERGRRAVLVHRPGHARVRGRRAADADPVAARARDAGAPVSEGYRCGGIT